jgi:hypothetical protein
VEARLFRTIIDSEGNEEEEEIRDYRQVFDTYIAFLTFLNRGVRSIFAQGLVCFHDIFAVPGTDTALPVTVPGQIVRVFATLFLNFVYIY